MTPEISKAVNAKIREKVATPKTKVSEKGRAILKLINKSDFGCQKSNVAKLMTLVTGEKLVLKETKGDPQIGGIYESSDEITMVTGIDDDGDAYVVYSKGKATRWTKRVFTTDNVATDEQIDEFYKELHANVTTN